MKLGQYAENEHQKLVPEHYLILVNRNIANALKKVLWKKVQYFERGLSKVLKNFNFFDFESSFFLRKLS